MRSLNCGLRSIGSVEAICECWVRIWSWNSLWACSNRTKKLIRNTSKTRLNSKLYDGQLNLFHSAIAHNHFLKSKDYLLLKPGLSLFEAEVFWRYTQQWGLHKIFSMTCSSAPPSNMVQLCTYTFFRGTRCSVLVLYLWLYLVIMPSSLIPKSIALRRPAHSTS